MHPATQRRFALIVLALFATTTWAQDNPRRKPQPDQDRPAARQNERRQTDRARDSRARRDRAERRRADDRAERRAAQRGERRDSRAAAPRNARPPKMHFFKMRHNDPREVAKIIAQLQPALRDEVHVAVDERTQTLIVAAQKPQTHEAVKRLLDVVDRPQEEPEDWRVVYRVHRVKHREAPFIASQLQNLLVRQKRDCRIVADEAGHAIWLAGLQSEIEPLLEVAEQMDRPVKKQPAKARQDDARHGKERRGDKPPRKQKPREEPGRRADG